MSTRCPPSSISPIVIAPYLPLGSPWRHSGTNLRSEPMVVGMSSKPRSYELLRTPYTRSSQNHPSRHSGKYVGWFGARDALVEVDYMLRLHEHALCDDNSLWKERRVEPNSYARADKVAIVTAAGSGMGAACARELASRGYALALMSPSGKAEDLAKELGGLGLTGSVTEDADLESLVGETLVRYGRIDGVVNSTGHPPSGEILELTDEQWHATLDLVVLNAVRMAR